MGDYIDREKLIEKLKKDPLFDLVERYGITGVIESIPAADVEPVVRCRDCIHLSGVTNGGTFFRCDRYDKWQDESQRVYMPLDGFCSYGQKGEKTNDS